MTDLFRNKYRIPSARLQTWNHADNGLYFITICTANRECFFGNVVNSEMQLNDLGRIVEEEWLKTPHLRPDMNLELKEYVVMPNHFHAIIYIGQNQYNTTMRYDNGRDAMYCVSTKKNEFGPQRKNLASVIRGFKSAVTTFAKKNNMPFEWQTRFHDHIITTHDEYIRVADYIINNPVKWQKDMFYKKYLET